MFVQDTVLIRGAGEPELLHAYTLAADIEHWPAVLPHYRFIRIRQRDGLKCVADFGASRSGFPCSWQACQVLWPEERRITYEHLRGVTRGMKVQWRFSVETDGVRMTVDHSLTYRVPLAGELFARLVVGRLFVHHIAGRTLDGIRKRVVAEAG